MFAKLMLDVVAQWLDGYKTYIAGIGLIASGIAGIIGHYWPDAGMPNYEPTKALDTIAMGLMAIGVGRKMDKMTGGGGGDIKRAAGRD
ncbi:MAG: hypothetical protein AB7U43_09755 [Desulfobacter sp.]